MKTITRSPCPWQQRRFPRTPILFENKEDAETLAETLNCSTRQYTVRKVKFRNVHAKGTQTIYKLVLGKGDELPSSIPLPGFPTIVALEIFIEKEEKEDQQCASTP